MAVVLELVDQVADALIAVTPDGVIRSWSAGAERVFGYAAAEAAHRPLAELVVPPEHRADDAARFAAAAATGATTYEAARVRKDGARIRVDVSIRAVHENGALAYFAVSKKDVTDLAHAREAALRLVSKELESFTYSVSHDLRAPLRGVSGFAQILLEDFGAQLPAEALEHLNEIRDNAARTGNLIDALQSLSRVVHSELHREHVDLGSLARTFAAHQAAAEPDREVKLVTSGHLVVSADPTLARTLLEHLLDNAWKFTRRTRKPRVELGELAPDGARAFYVRDNGAGFDMAFVERLFGAFQRLHPAREFPGVGIGLATAQRIVQRHGGRIWAEATVGAGATFRFTLPEER